MAINDDGLERLISQIEPGTVWNVRAETIVPLLKELNKLRELKPLIEKTTAFFYDVKGYVEPDRDCPASRRPVVKTNDFK